MGYLSVVVAAIGSYAFGAIWYMMLAKPWMAAAGIESDASGKPKERGNATPYFIAFFSAIVVAGMMRHVFGMAGIDTAYKGLTSGLGLGAFIASPWIFTNCAFGMRPMKLALIDSGYATIGCGIMGLILTVI